MDLRRALVEDVVRSIGSRSFPERDSLTHYSSKYYDPVKAKEYYERTKKLKGRQPAKMNEREKKVWDVSKDNLSKAKVKETENAAKKQKARLEAMRTKADKAKLSIENKMASLAAKLEADVKQLQEANKALPLNPIPDNATPKQRAFLEKQNQQIRSANAAKANKLIKGQAQAVRSAAKDAQVQRRAIGDGLRTEIKKARDNYKVQKEAIQAKYEKADKTEQANIRAQVR